MQDRRANQDVLIAAVSDFTRLRTKQELLRHFGGKVPFSPVYNVRDIVADPHFKARDMLPWVPHPGLDHEVQTWASKMTETPGKVRHRAPLCWASTPTSI